jgi:uncharacterized protein YqgC (DUF456 family)
MDLLTGAGILVGLLFLAGLIGSVVPWMPGPLFILAGALVWAVATDFATIGAGRLIVLTALAALSFLLNFVVGAVGARRHGATRWGTVGALVGGIVGLFFGPLGLLVGTVAGAVGAEIMAGTDVARGMRSGYGALVGLLAGLLADLVIALTMIGLFLFWVWRG